MGEWRVQVTDTVRQVDLDRIAFPVTGGLELENQILEARRSYR